MLRALKPSLEHNRKHAVRLLRQYGYHAYAWFPLDRNGIVKSCTSNAFKLTARRFVRIYDKNFLGCKFEAILVRFLLSVLIHLFIIS